MIVVMKDNVSPHRLDEICRSIETQDVEARVIVGLNQTVIGLLGDTTSVDIHCLETIDEVVSVKRISESFKYAQRALHPQDSVIHVGEVVLGGPDDFVVMAGPCSVESEEQAVHIARSVKASGAQVFRAGAFKPRTSPYVFQGLGKEGLDILRIVKQEVGMPIVSEIMDVRDLEFFEDVDILQVGARNMQNFSLLKELGKINKPVLLKRSMSATIDELLLSAEYILSGGNSEVILCERGIRTFENRTRNTFDVSAIPVLRELTHLPVIADPSHATGYARFVSPVALAACAAGAQGLEIEVHHSPQEAASDGIQAITCDAFNELMKKIQCVRSALNQE